MHYETDEEEIRKIHYTIPCRFETSPIHQLEQCGTQLDEQFITHSP